MFFAGSVCGAELVSPVAGLKSTDEFEVDASAPPAGSGTVTASVYWRSAGTANGSDYSPSSGSTSGWTEASTLDPIEAGKSVSISAVLSGSKAAASLGQDGSFRVSIGAAKNHFKDLSAWRQKLQPYHVHMEKSGGAIYKHRTGVRNQLWPRPR